MIYWDASAIVPLLIAEAETRRLRALAARDPDMTVWWASAVECVSALARRERAALLDARSATRALDRLNRLTNVWTEVEPTEIVRETAMRFLRVHPLRAADALQLAAAFVAAENRPASLQLITLDARLEDAARKEGFAVLDVAAR
jgi:predicted nucleic acid-binding protein